MSSFLKPIENPKVNGPPNIPTKIEPTSSLNTNLKTKILFSFQNLL